MKTRRIISFILALLLVTALLPTAALASSAHTAHSGSCDHEGWTKLWMDGTVLMAGDTACPDNEDDGGHDYFLPAGSYRLEGDLTTDKTIIIEGAVNLCLNGHSIIESGNRDGIAVNLGGTLNLYDESGNSGVITHADGVMGGAVWCNGEFNMYGGTISGNNLPSGTLGIVSVNGKFTMAGGVITGNEAGGDIVDVAGSGTFTMTGGTISGNKVFRDGGGVFVDYGCVFEMTGGTIENNTAGQNGSNVCIWNNGTFRLGGGTIADITYLADGTPSGSVYIYEGGIFEKLAAPPVIEANTNSVSEVHPGDSFRVPVRVTVNGGFAAAQISLSYESDKLTLDSLEIGAFADPASPGGQSVTATQYLRFGNATTETGVLFFANFTVKDDAAAGETEIGFDSKLLGDADANPITGVFTPGSVTIAKAALSSGTWGTCPWEIDADGKLTVYPGIGADTDGSLSPWADYKDKIKSVVFREEGGGNVKAPQYCRALLKGLSNAAEIDLSGLDTGSVTNASSMFNGCVSLASLTFGSAWNTSGVKDMGSMFDSCRSLASLDLSGWNTGSVEDMGSMFSGCSSLTSLTFGQDWNTGSVKRMSNLFCGCSSLTSLDLSDWNTSKVTKMDGMFDSCTSLTSLDLLGWKTDQATDMTELLAGCTSLTELTVPAGHKVTVKASDENGGRATITDLQKDGEVTVTAVTNTGGGYSFRGWKEGTALKSDSEVYTFTPDAGTDLIAVFSNAENTLQIGLEVDSLSGADKERPFPFTVTLTDDSINGTYGDLTFADGVAAHSLKNGETATASGLPAGIGYTLAAGPFENFDVNGITTDDAYSTSGTIQKDGTEKKELILDRETGMLAVKNEVRDADPADADREFPITVTLSDRTVNGFYNTGYTPDHPIVFTDGVATFTLKNGEQAEAYALPVGVTVSVTAGAVEGYTSRAFLSAGNDPTIGGAGLLQFEAHYRAYPAIRAQASPAEGGTVSSGKCVLKDEPMWLFSASVTAVPNDGYCFAGWTESGSRVSADAVYGFDTDGPRTLVANFVPTSVQVLVTDCADGEAIEGATVQILDPDGKVFDEWVSADEAHETKGLNVNTEYTLRETVAPEGYRIAAEAVFRLDVAGRVTTTGTSDGSLLYLENEKTAVSILVTDGNNAPFAGATVQILDPDGKVVEEWVSGGAAHRTDGLRTDTEYTVRERVAPDTYAPLADGKFTIDEVGKVTFSGEIDAAGNLLLQHAAPISRTVTVTPGANMMIAAGANEQTVRAGDAMERVVYLASEGYYFPEDYTAASVNGVAVMRDSFTRITVFGTPTADASITLPDPTAKAKEQTPTATFTATGPDSGTLTGVTAGMTYAIDGGAAIAITGESIDLTGLAPCTITVIQPGNGTTTIDSEAQTITITKAETPNLTATQPSIIGGKGSIPTAAEHEFSTDGTTWTACTGETTGLVPGTYYVRVKAADTVLASDAQELVIIAPGSVAFSGRVTLNGRPMTAGDTFTFEVSANGTVIATAQSDATGNIDFTEINYFFSDVGQHSYTVKQSATTLPGVAIDGREYTVDVIVSYNPGDAALTVTPSDNFTGLYFTNTYDKQTPPGYSVPTGLEAIYGQTLADVTLPDGWAWDDALTTKVGSVGDHTFSATFTPADTTLYSTMTADLTVAVSKATPDCTAPDGLTAIYGQTLADVTLPDGWAWDDAPTTSVGNVGDNTFSAAFTPEDTENYSVVTVPLTVSVTKAGTPSSDLTEDEKPKAVENLIEDVFEQALVTAPEKLPEGYTGIEYSTDGENWSDTIPTGKKAGEYTVRIKYIGDANHENFTGDPVAVSIVKAVYSFALGEGEELTYTKESGKELTATVVQTGAEDTSFEHFAGVYIGEAELQKDVDYTVKKGSTVVTVLPAALDKLDVGNHTLTVRFTNGEASTRLTLLAASSGAPSSQTGDNGRAGLWIILTAASAIAATSLSLPRRRKKGSGR